MDIILTLWGLDTADLANDYLTKVTGDPFRVHNFIDNEFVKDSQTEEWIDTFNPRTGKVFAQVHRSATSDVDRAVDAASRAFPIWSRTTRQDRSDVLLRIASILEDKKELFAVWESIDQGKTLARARVEVDRAISNFRYDPLYYHFYNTKISEDTSQHIFSMKREPFDMWMAPHQP
jgi:acyl-CoA reductase-like NAD-dependent aldehyde dehydrogenase